MIIIFQKISLLLYYLGPFIGDCVDDQFSISGALGAGTPTICGTNTGYHSKSKAILLLQRTMDTQSKNWWIWQTKYASAKLKNLRLGFNFSSCSEGYFLSEHPQSVTSTISYFSKI